MATPTIQGEIADFFVAQYDANPTFIEQKMAQFEGGAQAGLVNLFKNIHVSGIEGIFLGYAEGGVEAFVAELVAKYPPNVLYPMIGAYLADLAKSLGG